MDGPEYSTSYFPDSFFEMLDLRTAEIPGIKQYSFYADIGGRKLELCFEEKEQAAVIERCLAGRILRQVSAPDARFHFWIDDCSRFAGKQDAHERLRFEDERGWLLYIPGHWFISAKTSSRDFYYCLHSPGKSFPIPYWAVSTLVYQWAGTAGLLPLHGGAVGVDGRGVLLAAGGHGGKSTLSATCLLSGMDFITDDFMLVSAQGPLVAKPIFSMIKMNMDMKNRLKLNLPVIWSDRFEEGKQVLDASAFSFCQELPLHAVMFLSFSEEEEPVIVPYRGPAAVKLVQTVLLNLGAYEPARAGAIVKRISSLPAYEMRLGKNLLKNAEELRRWIERI